MTFLTNKNFAILTTKKIQVFSAVYYFRLNSNVWIMKLL